MRALQGCTVDFDSQLEVCRCFDAAGACIRLETNSSDIVEHFSRQFSASDLRPGFTFQVRVHNHPNDLQLGAPRFFGIDQYAGALFGDTDFLSFDLLQNSGLGFFSFVTASDDQLWRRTILPTALGLIGPQLGVIPIHCAALQVGGRGVLISGLSGAGKSTLAAALAEAGMGLVSDDWAFASDDDGLRIAGMAAPLKLMPDAARFFPRLANYSPRTTLNGEIAYEVEAAELFGGQPVRECKPQVLLLLERGGRECHFSKVGSEEALAQLYASLEPAPKALKESERNRERVLRAISRLSWWRFVCGGTPQEAAQAVIEFLSREVAA